MRRPILRPCLLLSCGFVLALLAGCGNKGPLYMPPPPAAAPAKPKPAATPAPAPASTAMSPAEQH